MTYGMYYGFAFALSLHAGGWAWRFVHMIVSSV